MSDLTLYGPAFSSYVRTARMACEEKGVGYTLEPLDLGSEALHALHPFDRIPAMRHGDFQLYETSAICRYVDTAFEGPALTPSDPKSAARMEQWISAANAYMDHAMIRVVVINRLVKPSRGGTPDEALIAETLPSVHYQLDVLDKYLKESDFLAGTERSIADFFLAPMIGYLKMTPEGSDALPKRKALSAWFDRIQALPSFVKVTERPADAAE